MADIIIGDVKLDKPLSKYIDHTLLKPESTTSQIDQICAEALEYDFASVCVNTVHAKRVSTALKDSNVKTCCVVGFPLGAMSSNAKAYETKYAIENGANEIDMVINIGAAKSGDWSIVKDDIKAVIDAADKKVLIKVIIETCLLTDDEKRQVCMISKEAGADFVKTSTGFSTGGATVHDITLMREIVGTDTGVKASGGIRDLDTTLAMIKAGANRIGASAGVAIMKEASK